MTRPDLDAIQARADAATEGPWTVQDGQLCESNGMVMPALHHDHLTGTEPDWEPPDPIFIAAARTDVPALVAYAKRLEEELQATKDGYAQYRSCIKGAMAWE